MLVYRCCCVTPNSSRPVRQLYSSELGRVTAAFRVRGTFVLVFGEGHSLWVALVFSFLFVYVSVFVYVILVFILEETMTS